MSSIHSINVGGVDYDIVSESAEKKIAELEKNNSALASITLGTRNDYQDPVRVQFGGPPVYLGSTTDIYIGQDVSLSVEGVNIGSGSECPINMHWGSDNRFFIQGGYGNNEISIGSDDIRFDGKVVGGGGGGSSSISGVDIRDGMQIQLSKAGGLCFGSDIDSAWETGLIGTGMRIRMYNDELSIDHNPSGFSLRISSVAIECNGNNMLADAGGSGSGSSGDSYVESHDGTELNLGTEGCSIIALSGNGYDLQIGKSVSIGGHVSIGGRVAIGTALQQGEMLHIKGPVYLEATTGTTALTIGTDGKGYLKIDWGESDKIVFTNLKSGKKATLELS
jgi:hypothetical protein